MPLKINGTNITDLFINGEEYKALKIDAEAYFCKRYNLNQNESEGVTFTINRTSSPNQQAGTGNIGTGDTIFYGDTIAITAVANPNYASPKLYVDLGDGEGAIERSNGFSFTVENDVSYYGVAELILWTGNEKFYESGSFAVFGPSGAYNVSVTAEVRFDRYYENGHMEGCDGIHDDCAISTEITTAHSSIKDQILQTWVFGYDGAYVDLWWDGGKVNFEFNINSWYGKGTYTKEVPYSLTITEVRRVNA